MRKDAGIQHSDDDDGEDATEELSSTAAVAAAEIAVAAARDGMIRVIYHPVTNSQTAAL